MSDQTPVTVLTGYLGAGTTTQLNNILLYMEKLGEVDTTGVEPETHAIAIQNAFREDVVRESLPHELSLANAPSESGNCYRVPKVIE